jgi:hypothetical protein
VSRLCRLRGAGRPRSRQPSNSASPTSASPTAAERPPPGRPPPRPTARRGFFPTPALRENGALVGPEEAPSRAARRTAPPGHTTPQSGRRRAPARRRRSDSATARRAGRRSPGRRRSVEPLPGASCAITTRAARRRLPGAVLLPSSSHPFARAWPVEGSRCSTTCSCGQGARRIAPPAQRTSARAHAGSAPFRRIHCSAARLPRLARTCSPGGCGRCAACRADSTAARGSSTAQVPVALRVCISPVVRARRKSPRG